MRTILLLPPLLVGCGTTCEPALRAIMTLSEGELEFGSLADGERVERTVMLANEGNAALGVSRVHIGDASSGASPFDVAYDACSIECDGDVAAKGVDVDTGGASETGSPADTGDYRGPCAGPDDTLFVLDPGCRIALTVGMTGDADLQEYDALVVQSVTEVPPPRDSGDTGAAPPLAYRADLLHSYAVAWLHGDAPAAVGVGELVALPGGYEYGFVYPGRSVSASFRLANIGDGDLALLDVALNGACSSEWVITAAPTPGTVLAPSADAAVDLTYTPTSVTASYCRIEVQSDVGDAQVTVGGNLAPAIDSPPSVTITSPAPGLAQSSAAPLDLVLAVADAEQPVSTLTCTVESVVLGGGVVADCSPPDDTGVVTVTIPGGTLLPGADTLRVTLTDVHAGAATAAVSVRLDTPATGNDNDGDGFDAPSDCDDADATTWPEASELADGRDNDCDLVVDEGTTNSDDDGDGSSEADGDFDDTDTTVYPGAPERIDGLDNDCDGVVDEDTMIYDDDGDGFSDVDNDCDDANAAIHPGAAEQCDGIDDDCNGLRDDGDACGGRPGYVIGDVIAVEQTSLLEGETISLEIRVAEASGDVTYSWSTDDGATAFSDAAAAITTFTASEVAEDEENVGRTENIYAIVQDDLGQDWVFGRVAVWDERTDLYADTECVAGEEGCGSGCAGGGAAVVFGLGLALATARRKR